MGSSRLAAARRALTEALRRVLTAVYHVQARLPSSLARQWRLGATLLLQAIPAIDPTEDPYLTTYEPPARCRPADDGPPRDGVLITGATGFVGLHLLEHLLCTTPRRLFVLVRSRSVAKLRKEAERYRLALPDFDARVVLLDGDCKRANLGLSAGEWARLAGEVGQVFHLAANSSFVATYEVLRTDWMPSFAALLEWCAAHAVAFHMVGSVGRFAVEAPAHRTRRGVWTSGYMRCKAVQYALLERFRARGLTGSWVDCAYVVGTLRSGGVNPGFHDSMWKAAALQRAVGLGFPGDATLVPVDLLVGALWLNASQPAAKVAPYMALRLRAMMTSAAIGVGRQAGADEFLAAAVACGFSPALLAAFVPPDIRELVALMHRPFEAPPAVAALFKGVDEAALLRANFEYAKPQFAQLDSFMPRAPPRPAEADVLRPAAPLPAGALRAARHANAALMGAALLWNANAFWRAHPRAPRLLYLAFLSHWTICLVTLYFALAARATHATPPASRTRAEMVRLLQSVALPASIATVPLFWGQKLLPHLGVDPATLDPNTHASNLVIHGVHALCMLGDFLMARRAWRGLCSDAGPVLVYSFVNMAFMAGYFYASGCHDAAAPACDLDGRGHPYVYVVVDWRRPAEATAVCLAAILVPVPLISAWLARLSRPRAATDGAA